MNASTFPRCGASASATCSPRWRDGWRDFWQKPSHLAFLGLIYPLVGAALAVWTSGNNSWPLLFPLISGFALVGPLAALPIYEMSRRQELGLDTHWSSRASMCSAPLPSPRSRRSAYGS